MGIQVVEVSAGKSLQDTSKYYLLIRQTFESGQIYRLREIEIERKEEIKRGEIQIERDIVETDSESEREIDGQRHSNYGE